MSLIGEGGDVGREVQMGFKSIDVNQLGVYVIKTFKGLNLRML